MGDRIGLPKFDMRHTGSTKVTKRMLLYCQRDTEITGRFVQTMSQKYESIGCELRPTIASTTLKYFEDHHSGKLRHPFTEEQIDFFHSGYYGGRTEIFHNAPIEGTIWYHDINSLYPSVMRDRTFPKLESYYETSKPNISDRHGVADVTLQAPRNLALPYLPCQHEGKLVFPLGKWRGIYTFFELKEAQKLGYRILRVHRSLEFPETVAPFKDFIEHLYTERMRAKQSGDDLLQTAYKDLMNHGYGKFAQKNESTKLIPIKDAKVKAGDILFGDLVFRKERIKYPRFANCVWANYVTAYARHSLYQALNRIRESGGLLLYCDTDSVIYEHKNQILENNAGDLGKFKLEGSFSYAHFKLPKLYALKRDAQPIEYKAKGVPRAQAADFFTKNRAIFKKPNKLRESLRRNLNPKRRIKIIPNYWEEKQKELVGKYNKRIVLKNGETSPLIIK